MNFLKDLRFKSQDSRKVQGSRFKVQVPGQTLVLLLVLLDSRAGLRAQNLVSNPDFNATGNPLKDWRIDFPYEQPYAKNAGHVKVSADVKQGSANAVEIALPKAVAENEGGKIESAFIKAQPGATYRASVDCMTGDFSAMVYVDAYAPVEHPPGQPVKGLVPAHDGMPALIQIYRKQFPVPPALSKTWTTAKAEFKLPEKWVVEGKPVPPAYVAFRVFVFSATTATVPDGKANFTHFQLTASK